MRKLHKTRNYSALLGLVEEVQTLANRMEAALGEKKDYAHWHDLVKKEKQDLNDLLQKTNKLRKKQGKKEKTIHGINDNNRYF
jgi:hypothetical protein